MSRVLRASLIGSAAAAAALALSARPAGAVAWVGVQKLEAGVFEPHTIATPAGELVVLWVRREKTENFLEGRVRAPGGSFGAAFKLEGPVSTIQFVTVSTDAAGDVLAVWQQGSLVEAAVRPAGGSFGKPQLVSAEGESGSSPSAVLTPGGEAVAAWQTNAGTFEKPNYQLKAAARAPGATEFGAPQLIEESGPLELTKGIFEFIGPHMVTDTHGDVTALWRRAFEEMEGAKTHQEALKVAERSPGSSFATPITLASVSETGGVKQVLEGERLVSDAAGDMLAVWAYRKAEPAVYEIVAKLKPAGGTFTASSPEVVSTRKESREPAAALDEHGNALVASVGEDLLTARPGVLVSTRPAGGKFSTVQTVSEPSTETGPGGPQSPAAAFAHGGEAVVTWTRYVEPSHVESASRAPGAAAFGPPEVISPDQKSGYVTASNLFTDALGDTIATWQGNFVPELNVRDGAGPALGSLQIPATGLAGVPVSFSVSPLDAFSALGPTGWSFGDGASASETSVTHTYAKPGAYQVTVTGQDMLGNATSTTATITIAEAPAPKITAAKESHRTWREGSKLAKVSAVHGLPVGTTFSFAVDQAAKVSMSFTQPAPGRRAGHRCVAVTKHNRKGKPCKRTVSRGTLAFAAKTGPVKVAFQGRVSRTRKLAPGRYTLVITAANEAGAASGPVRLSFAIRR